jgi:hypothetical protein
MPKFNFKGALIFFAVMLCLNVGFFFCQYSGIAGFLITLAPGIYIAKLIFDKYEK